MTSSDRDRKILFQYQQPQRAFCKQKTLALESKCSRRGRRSTARTFPMRAMLRMLE